MDETAEIIKAMQAENAMIKMENADLRRSLVYYENSQSLIAWFHAFKAKGAREKARD